ncbi:hypothetical protein [Azospirillum sp. BE72]|uniref:phosphorylase family protein n=1 Tax=Azospirillum sp. BE72 TaxID=2817776 RepID=UPI002856AC79|nr:hypothetical protein [Azospirillum sp. BE72]MDR6772679.1 nucleoside phosphorylase [Azospirillum sp. BE72]
MLTALSVEIRAVLAHLTDRESVRGDLGIHYECGRFRGPSDEWYVIVAQTAAGTHTAGTIAQGGLQDFRDVDVVLFIGVAASLKPELSIGSVVASSQIYNVHAGKQAQEHLERPASLAVDFELCQIARHVERNGAWLARIIPPAGISLSLEQRSRCPIPPRAEVAAIATGEKVLADGQCDLVMNMRRQYNNAVAYEMEGYGVLFAVSHFAKTPCIVVRGISDLMDGKTPEADALFQPIAAAHAAAFSFEVLLVISRSGALASPQSPEVPATWERGAARDARRASLVLSINGDPAALDRARLDAIVDVLHSLTGDRTITLTAVEAGSVNLVLNAAWETQTYLMDGDVRKHLAAKAGITIRTILPESVFRATAELKYAFRSASEDLRRWERTLPGGTWMERQELAGLLDTVRSEPSSTFILLGEPGSGKSALLSKAVECLDEARVPVLAVKADLLPADLSRDSDLAAHLRLPVDAATALRNVARSEPVVLVIDQLDALAGYLDLRTGRLNVLLNLVRDLSGTPNVHILLSSRLFEFRHDVRLRSIAADEVGLTLPPWHTVAATLRERGIESENWPDVRKDLLRSPQALRIFLTLLTGTQEDRIESGYRGMLGQLWRDRLQRTSEGQRSARLATELALAMAEEETLWLPRMRYDEREDLLTCLESSGLIIATPDGLRIGFSHQTVFEHALARTFAKDPDGLANYIRERKGSLFVRPHLWAGLGYLRDGDPAGYGRVLADIWNAPDLRRHLRHLLVEFMAGQREPIDVEACLLIPALKEPVLAAVAFRTAAGSAGWFDRLKHFALPEAMEDEARAHATVPLLSEAWGIEADAVDALLREAWLPHAEKRWLVWLVLDGCRHWTDATVDLATAVLRGTTIAPALVSRLAATIGVEQPDMALRIVRAALDRAMEDADAETRQAVRTPPNEATDIASQIAWELENNPQGPYKKILNNYGDWDDLAELARIAPLQFLINLWPWYLRLFRCLEDRKPVNRRGFVHGRYELDHLVGEDGSRSPPPLIDAVATAVRTAATEQPEAFRIWAFGTKSVEMPTVQRLIAVGFLADSERYAGDILRFLLDDPRRLMLGTTSDRFSESKRLIAASVPHLPDESVLQLERAVLSFESFDRHTRDWDDRRKRRRWIREDRLRLLRAFPAERLSQRVRQRVPEEERALGSPPDWDIGPVEGGYIGSPMSAEAMVKAKDEDILNALAELDDATGWDHPRDWMKGGSIPLSRAFAEFARAAPERAFRLMRQMQPGRQERPAAYAIEAMAGDDGDPDTLLDVIRELDQKGFGAGGPAKDEYRHSIAIAVTRLAGRQASVPDDIVALFLGWLAPPEPRAEAEAGAYSVKPGSAKDEARSILWDTGSIHAVAGGNYSVLAAIRDVLLSRTPKEADRWLEVLHDHLSRPEDDAVWKELLRSFPQLVHADHDRAAAFLDDCFARYPDLLWSTAGVQFLARARSWVGEARLRAWLEAIRGTKHRRAQQSYGELVGLIHVADGKPAWSAEAVDSVLGREGNGAIRKGLAHSAAHLFPTRAHRDAAAGVLVRLLKDADEPTAAAVRDVFRLVDALQPDGPTIRLLSALANEPQRLGDEGDEFFIQALASLLPNEADLVARLARLGAERWAGPLADIRTSMAATAPELVDVALTLHRLGGPLRQRGLELFETMLDLGAYGSRDALAEIDRRPQAGSHAPRPRLRRRRRSHRHV